jgi:hypothetical protein
MRRLMTMLAIAGLLLAAAPTAAAALPRSDLKVGPMLGVVHAKGAGRSPFGGGGGNPDLKYHNGPVMADGAYVVPIFWGPKWGGTNYQGDVVGGLEDLYAAFNDSGYMNTNTEYTQTDGRTFSKAVTRGASIMDYNATPKRAPKTSDVLAVVSRNIGTDAVANGYYPVYTDIKRGGAGYCAWHSWGKVNGVTVQFAFFFDLTGDSGCDPNDPGTTHSQNLEALANVSGHELSEAVTDPHGDAWYDTSGYENSDKCAWKFDQPVSLSNGNWKIQGNWSNNAYDAGTGYPNSSGQPGCLYN